jgi:dihydroorotate dehydrogenase electron transfer subunit
MHLETNAIVTDNVSFFPKAAVSVERKMMDIRLMWLESPTIAGEAKPGQFVMVRCGDLSLPRPLSIHRIKNGSLAILFAVLRDGKGTRWLSERKPDDRVQLLGPLGNGFRIDSTSSTLLLVAGGMGIAPLYFLANQAVSKHFNVTLLIGAHTGQLLYPRHLMPVGIHVFAATDDGSDGQTGMVTSLISRHAERADQLFVCGPLAMYREMSINKNRLGLEGKPVQVSIEATMGCGHGVCYGCTVATRQGLRQVCKDGPVFELGDLSLTDLS